MNTLLLFVIIGEKSGGNGSPISWISPKIVGRIPVFGIGITLSFLITHRFFMRKVSIYHETKIVLSLID